MGVPRPYWGPQTRIRTPPGPYAPPRQPVVEDPGYGWLLLVGIVIVVTLVASAVLYVMVSGLIGGTDSPVSSPSVILASQGCGAGTCNAIVTDASRSVGFTELGVTLLENGTPIGNIVGLGNLPLAANNLTLSFMDTSIGGTFNTGDQFFLDGGVAGSNYEIQLLWNDVDVFVPIASVVLSP